MQKRLCLLFVWECCGVLGHRKIFQTLVVAMSGFDFSSSCTSLGVDLSAFTLLDPLLS